MRKASFMTAAVLALAGALNPAPIRSQTTGTSAPKKTATTPGAVLLRGAEPVRGLPGFGTNAFPALYGEYGTAAEGTMIRVWATREALYFNPQTWKPRALGSYRILERAAEADDAELPAGGSFRLAALDRPFTAAGLGAIPSEWTLVLAFPADLSTDLSADGTIDRFLATFLNRFASFLYAAKAPTDVSFPAVPGN